MNILNCSGVSVYFGVDRLFENVSFSLEEGDKAAIIGVNGAGKTTLLKVITGEMVPTDGTVSVSRGKSVGILSQHDALDSEKSVYEEMLGVFSECVAMEKRLDEIQKEMTKENFPEYLPGEFSILSEKYKKAGGYEYRSRTKSTLNRLGFPDETFDKKISLLSGGQKTSLALVRLLLRDPDIMILDEPTNHLDMSGITWLEEHLRKIKNTVIVVSHDRYFLDRVTSKTIELENGRATFYPCPYSEYRVRKEKDREIAEKHYKNQQKEINRLKEYIEQQRRWNRERNIIAAESREKALERMVKVEKPENEPKALKFNFSDAVSSGNDVLSVKNVSMGFSGRYLFKDLSFEIKKGERFFIIGKNGCGKSTLLKLMMNIYEPYSGKLTFGYNCRIGYYDQESQGLDMSGTVISELWRDGRMTENEVRSILAVFMFRGDDVFKEVSALSGGERARLTLAKLFLNKMNVLILDEPTNHLDIKSREALENALKNFEGTVIAVSHDRYFIKSLADHILEITDGVCADFMGGYEDYLAKRSILIPEEEKEAKEASVSENKLLYLKTKEERAREKKRLRDLEKAESRITELEQELENLGKLERENESDYKALQEISEKKEACEAELERLYSFLAENE